MATTDKNGFVHQIGLQEYYIEIYLYNQLDGYEPFPVRFSSVNSFSIDESLYNWITKGWIIINQDFEVLERGALETVIDDSGTPVTIPSIKAPYVFRTDGRNKISFRIRPIGKNIDDSKYPKEMWEMSFDFVIYDIEDLPTEKSQKKARKYYFWDERYQIFSERNIEYSTYYTALKNINFNGAPAPNNFWTDEKRAYNPNVVLQDIIATASNNPPVMDINIANSTSITKVGFSENGSIKSPEFPIGGKDAIDNDNWDLGNNSNKILYTSPANCNAIDDITYVLDHCVSTDNSPVFLDLGRSSNDKKWKLISLSKLFKNSKKDQIERLLIEDSVLVSGKPPYPRAYIDINDDANIMNFTSPIASRITSYKFSPMVASDDARIVNSPIHTYDFSTGKFNITFTDNTAESVRDEMQKYGKDALYNFTSYNPHNSNSHILLNMNLTKRQGYQINNVFVSQKFYPKNLPQVKMIKDALFLNESISFQVRGLTMRTPGKFIYIDRLGSNGDLNPFDDRFLGQWLIIKVNHVFSKSDYMTEIVAVKVDSFSQLWTQNEQKY